MNKRGSVGKRYIKPWSVVRRVLHQLVRPTVAMTISKQGWTKNASVVAQEFARALYCKAAYRGGDSLDCSLPPKLDACWHDLILGNAPFCSLLLVPLESKKRLETKRWRDVQNYLKTTLDHTQTSAEDTLAAKNKRVDTTVAIYKDIFQQDPDQDLWERERCHQLYLKSLNGRTLVMPIEPKTTIGDVYNFLEANGMPKDQFRLIHAGCHYSYCERQDLRLQDAKIGYESTIHCVGMIRGC